jgi:hypothetical protein
LLESIKNIATKHNIGLDQYIKICNGINDSNGYVNIDGLINEIQQSQHSAFNVAIGSKNNLGTTGNTINTLAPEITKFISNDPLAQQKTIALNQNSRGGKKSRRKRSKKRYSKKRYSKKRYSKKR